MCHTVPIMKPEILAQCNDAILTEAATRFGIDRSSLGPIKGFENCVCECMRHGQPAILRLSHSTHRSKSAIEAELEWVDYLAGHGLSVCRPLRSRHDRLVEPIELDRAGFSVVAFERAAGRGVPRDNQTSAMAVNRGRLLGQIHKLTKDFKPRNDTVKRNHWYDDPDFANYRSILNPADQDVMQRFAELIEELKSLQVERDTYGLIHTDAHTSNMFFDGDRPTLFDFDDCGYDYFISDIAIALFYTILFLPDDWNREEYARQFLRDILAGYREQNTLDDRWLEIIPKILKRREIILYVAIHRGMDMNNLDDWCRRYLDGRKERIVDNVPVLDIDYSAFA